MKVILFFILLVLGLNNGAFSQTLRQESVENTFKGITLIEKEQPNEAERAFRTASALDSLNAISDYNLGNTLFKQGAEEESFGHYKAASTKTNDESLSHQAFHNIGNVYMKRKEYQNAVQAYKEALKRNPNDDETRYNYALAKKMLEEEQKDQDQEQDQNQEQDQQNDQEQDQQKDQGEGGDQENQGDSDPKEDNSDDSGDNQKEKEEQKKGDGDQKEERGRKPENQPQQNDPKPQELSKQQIEALLQALQNEENKVQEKMNAQKVQGQKLKVEKDW